MAPDDIINENDGEQEEEQEQEPNIIDLNNYGMKPYAWRYEGSGGGGGSTGYGWNGTEITENPGSITVMISGADELSDLAEKVGVATIAYTAGWQNAWQLDLDGVTWVQFIGGEENVEPE